MQMRSIFRGILTPTLPVTPSNPKCTHNRDDLWASMKNGREITIKSGNEFFTGIVNGIEREDGSGFKFLVRLHNSPKVHYVKMA